MLPVGEPCDPSAQVRAQRVHARAVGVHRVEADLVRPPLAEEADRLAVGRPRGIRRVAVGEVGQLVSPGAVRADREQLKVSRRPSLDTRAGRSLPCTSHRAGTTARAVAAAAAATSVMSFFNVSLLVVVGRSSVCRARARSSPGARAQGRSRRPRRAPMRSSRSRGPTGRRLASSASQQRRTARAAEDRGHAPTVAHAGGPEGENRPSRGRSGSRKRCMFGETVRGGRVEFRLLGPLEVVDGERQIALGGVKQRSVLALLLLARGRPVPTDRADRGDLERRRARDGAEERAGLRLGVARRARRRPHPDARARLRVARRSR